MREHRQHPRFRLLNTLARGDGFDVPVVDLSRSGICIEPPRRLAAGSHLEFEICDRNHRLRVAGTVQWSRRSPGSDDGRAYRSGVKFVRIFDSNATGVWARLVAESGETGLPVGHRLAASDEAPRIPLLTILSPEDGTVTRHGYVTVIGQVRDPGLGAMIEVNGVRALVYGRRFEARVPLLEGANLVSATVTTSMAPVCRSPTVQVTHAPLPA